MSKRKKFDKNKPESFDQEIPWLLFNQGSCSSDETLSQANNLVTEAVSEILTNIDTD